MICTPLVLDIINLLLEQSEPNTGGAEHSGERELQKKYRAEAEHGAGVREAETERVRGL